MFVFIGACGLWNGIQSWLIHRLEDKICTIDKEYGQIVEVFELCAPQDYMLAYRWIETAPRLVVRHT